MSHKKKKNNEKPNNKDDKTNKSPKNKDDKTNKNPKNKDDKNKLEITNDLDDMKQTEKGNNKTKRLKTRNTKNTLDDYEKTSPLSAKRAANIKRNDEKLQELTLKFNPKGDAHICIIDLLFHFYLNIQHFLFFF